MEKEQFNHIINDIHLLSDVDVHAIEELMEKYPWCSIPYTMHAKLLHHRQENTYPAALAKAAAYSMDRSKLFAVIERTPLQIPMMEMADAFVDENEMHVQEIYSEDKETIQSDDKVAKDLTDDSPVFEYIPYEMEMQKAVIELEKAGEGTSLPAIPVEVQIDVRGELQVDKNASHSFSEWLSLLEGNDPVTLVHASAAHKPISVQVRKTVGRQAETEDSDIDFDEWKAKELAKKSTELNMDAVSETLASILVSQGKVDRAIEMYRHLCLKYPEKMPYFASLIDDLKNT